MNLQGSSKSIVGGIIIVIVIVIVLGYFHAIPMPNFSNNGAISNNAPITVQTAVPNMINVTNSAEKTVSLESFEIPAVIVGLIIIIWVALWVYSKRRSNIITEERTEESDEN